MSYLTYEEQQTILQLRVKGFAVVVFNPDELKGVQPDEVEDIMVARANEHIQAYGEPE